MDTHEEIYLQRDVFMKSLYRNVKQGHSIFHHLNKTEDSFRLKDNVTFLNVYFIYIQVRFT